MHYPIKKDEEYQTMKTMILYASIYGFTQDCVQKLEEALTGEMRTVNIHKDTIPSLEDYDTVLIGGSIYMGQIQKKIKKYCLSNVDTLKNKNIGFFISCGAGENYHDYFKTAFPDSLLEKALSVENFGGELRPDKMSFFHKFITNMIEKSNDKNNASPMKPLPENIKRMAKTLNNLAH